MAPRGRTNLQCELLRATSDHKQGATTTPDLVVVTVYGHSLTQPLS
jgi:hypothetical protein